MTTIRITAAGVMILLALPLSALHAQNDERADDVRHRDDCRLAHQVLTTGYPHPRWDWAIDVIDACKDMGGEAIAAAWAGATADALAGLFRASTRLRDQRIVDAVLEVARSEAVERPIRLTALRVLTSYVDPRVHARLEDMEPSDLEPWERSGLRRLVHTVLFTGSQPPDPATPDRIVAALAELAGSAADAHVRFAADYLHYELGRHIGRP